MKLDDKRKLTSRLNALKSTGPKTPHGKQASALNASTHGAYARSIVLPGESIADYEAMVEAHFLQYNPDNLIARCLVSQMATTLWRLNRIAPAESYMVRIQLDRMEPAIRIEFDDIPAAGLYALGVSSLESQGTAQSQLLSQERRLLTQYCRLRDVLLTLPQQPPPPTPVLTDFQSGNATPIFAPPSQEELPVETKLTAAAAQSAHPQEPQPESGAPATHPETKLPEPIKRTGPSFLPVTCQAQSPSNSNQMTYHHPIPLGTSTPTAPMLPSSHEERIQQERKPVPTAISSGSNPNQEKDLASPAGLSQ